MSQLGDLRSYVAFGLAIPGFVKKRLTLDEARAQIKESLETRNERFVRTLEKCIFEFPRSPYLPLLKAAGCELGDIRALVKNEGLEQTLSHLRDGGVYFSFEEFKGRRPVERAGVSFEANPDDFDNPVTPKHYAIRTGGTTGPRARVWVNLSSRDESEAAKLLAHDAHGLLGIPTLRWRPFEPSQFVILLSEARIGSISSKWFATRGPARTVFQYELARRLIDFAARMGGARVPKPEFVDPQDGLPAARWAEQQLASNGRCLIRATISAAVRVALAARDHGIDLHGTSFMGGGEPATPAKFAFVTETGAKWIPRYASAEGGTMGLGCANPVDGSDVHFFNDHLSLIQHQREVPGAATTVNAFNLTALYPQSPKVLLNVESDDFGILERRNCGCPLGDVGLDHHLRDIYSFGKLTGEGVTLVGNDMIRILEEVLPSRFGGSPLDYQFVEEEDDQNLTRLTLVISPRVNIDDEAKVISAVLSELESKGGAIGMAGLIWKQSGTLRIKRAEPTLTSAGKLMSLFVARRSTTKEVRQ